MIKRGLYDPQKKTLLLPDEMEKNKNLQHLLIVLYHFNMFNKGQVL